MTTENQKATDASSGSEVKTPSTTPPPPETKPTETPPVAATAKVEVKEGKVLVDGKSFVAESDLIAAKKSLEGQMTTQQTAHETAINATKLSESAALKEVATLNAKITENEQARESGAVTEEAAAKTKQELETAKSSIETLTNSSLETRRALLVLQYGVTADSIKDKSLPELASFEEAIKAVSTARGGGVGPYATGGGTGEAAPKTNIERAAEVLANTPVRGVRNEPPNT